MTILIIGLVVFLGTHSISIFARPFRNRMFNRSPHLWKIGFSVVSLIGLYLIAVGYAEARLSPTVLYSPPHWMRHLVMLLMLPVFPLVIASLVPGKIRSALKHPLLIAVKLWALVHLLANGMLADVLLFGSLLAWAVVTRISIKRRGEPVTIPPGSAKFDVIAVVAGLALYGFFVGWGHAHLIGMPLITR